MTSIHYEQVHVNIQSLWRLLSRLTRDEISLILISIWLSMNPFPNSLMRISFGFEIRIRRLINEPIPPGQEA